MDNQTFNTFVEVVDYWADIKPQNDAIVFESSIDVSKLSYGQLSEKSRRIAGALQRRGLKGRRVLLIYPQGIEFIEAFIGCLYAGVVAVPVFHPAPKEIHWEKLKPIMMDAELSAVLCEDDYLDKMTPWLQQVSRWSELQICHHNVIENESASSSELYKPQRDDIAFLQYTSGSTGQPKGVMISHGNMLHNASFIRDAMQTSHETTAVSWLPLFHDAGMIGMLLHMLLGGGRLVLFTPSAFVQRPVLWFELITKYRASYTGGPNFAFDLCAKRIGDSQLEGIDLSCLNAMFNGAEPVHWDTLELFSQRFEKVGFSKEALIPCYGLAESTLMVSGVPFGVKPSALEVDYACFCEGNIEQPVGKQPKKMLISCGPVDRGQEIIIVERHTGEVRGDRQIGEIWLKSDSISQGYFQNDSATKERFGNVTQDGRGPYYSTGDLGFIDHQQLYLTGRISDLIIINGKNHYPQDIERSIAEALAFVAPDGIAAFAEEIDGQEHLFVVAEVQRTYLSKLDIPAAVRDLTAVVAESHQLQVAGIALIKPVSIAKTTSGKVKRRACREAFLSQSLSYIKGFSPQDYFLKSYNYQNCSYDDVQKLGKELIATILQLKPTQLDLQQSLLSYGLDSLKAVSLAAIFSEQLGLTIQLDQLFNRQTIAELLQSLVSTAASIPVNKLLAPQTAGPFALTDMQMAYVVGSTDTFELGGVSLQAYLEFQGDIELVELERAWQQTIALHPMLRAELTVDGRQQIHAETSYFEIRKEDFRGLDQTAQTQALERVRQECLSHQFNLGLWPAFECHASLLSEQSTRLHFNFDGTFIDATSLQIVIDDLLHFYLDPMAERKAAPVSFQQYVDGVVQHQSSTVYKQAEDYWKHKAIDIPAAPMLPLQQLSKVGHHPGFIRLEKNLSALTWSRLQARCKEFGIGVNAVLLASYAKVLAIWSEQQAFTLNIPMQNRPSSIEGLQQVVGHFSTFTLAQFDFRQSLNWLDQVRDVQHELLMCLTNSAVSGMQILAHIRNVLDDTEQPSFPVVFTNLLGLDSDGRNGLLVRAEQVLGEMTHGVIQTPQVWLDCQVNHYRQGIKLNWDMVDGLLEEQTVNAMFSTFISFIEQMANKPSLWHERVGEQRPQQQIELLAKVNSSSQYLPEFTLDRLFTQSAYRHSARPALIQGELEFSYRQLDELSNKVAHAIIARGIVAEERVAIFSSVSWQQLVLTLGVVKAGAAYVPIDQETPQQRILDILSQANVSLVLCVAEVLQALPGVWLSYQEIEQGDYPQTPPSVKVDKGNLAYVLFTSGSTGRPKGVAIEHGAANNTLQDMIRCYQMNENDRVLALSNLSFDLSVFDLFALWAVGGAVVLPLASEHREPKEWIRLLQHHKISLWNTVPAMMLMLCEHAAINNQQIPSLRQILLSGDWLPLSLPQKIYRYCTNSKIVNMGGATEASIWSIGYQIDPRSYPSLPFIPYGKPMANQQFYILNEALEAVPIGVKGELFISGRGLAREYLGDAEKTAQSFFYHPHMQIRLYRTGDTGRYLSDGNIEFLGRVDHQVKLGGYRIELGEIEAVARELPEIETAIAHVGEINGVSLLCLTIQSSEVSQTSANNAEHSQVAFKFAQHGLRKLDQQGLKLAGQPTTDIDHSAYFARQSVRQFESRQIDAVDLGAFLAPLAALELGDGLLSKRRYPSAGSLYPVQVYLQIKPGRVAGIDGGFYYYHPLQHKLLPLLGGEQIVANVYLEETKPIVDAAAFTVFLITELAAIEPIYGDVAFQMSVLEAGYMSQLLMAEAGAQHIGVCPLGGIHETRLVLPLHLSDTHRVVHSLAGGPIREGQLASRQALEEPTKAASLIRQLSSHLAQRLPKYMMPKKIQLVSELPLTTNGKVDVGQLAEQFNNGNDKPLPIEVLDPYQKTIAAIWSELLDKPSFGLKQSILELGVNSIKVSQFVARLNQRLNAPLSLAQVFEHNTIASLASYLRETGFVLRQQKDPEIELEEGEIG